MDDVEVFVMADETLAEVLGRIGPHDRRTDAGPVAERPGWDDVGPLPRLVDRFLAEEARLVERLGGTAPDPDDLTGVMRAARAAARKAPGADLVEAAALRGFLAHDVAMALGSRACPLPEALALALLERMEPEEHRWRASGVFRDRLPLPAGHVSWRDRFLSLAGRDPHPFP